MKKKVEKKLYNLMFGEFSALIMFAFIWVIYLYILDKFDHYLTSMQNIYAFILLEFILLQGSIYWYLKWRKVKDNKSYNLSDSPIIYFPVVKKNQCLFIMFRIYYILEKY
ncbi:hypothetical protein [Peribacillus sp. TH24]|uniref:hypothetical protein n=1 Tax=Peribacillus sp. TH24 TaxID=2798483 RepID=UPI001F5BA5C1|nr:hypothetical protein [Peribacillus sp. TH24]